MKKVRDILKSARRVCKTKYFMARTTVAALLCLYCFPCSVYATAAITNKVKTIYTLVSGIITAAGAIVLAWGIFEFAAAYQSHDSSTQTQALKKVISGIIMCAASALITLLK